VVDFISFGVEGDHMRILHTADLHLGHSLNGWDREDEHRSWFDALADIVDREEVDLVLIAGDIYDNTNPSGEIQALFYQGLMALRARRPGICIVVSGGNHDPVRRLEAPSVLMKVHDIRVIGAVRRRAGTPCAETGQTLPGEIDLDHHLVAVRGADGEVALYVLAVPFLRASDLPGLSFDDTVSSSESPIVAAARRFFEEITASAVARMDALGHSKLPLVMTAHLHCAGGLESEGAERRIMIGGSHALPPDVFPQEISYVALGHLHRPQTLSGDRVRYSGSCFPLSASEIGYDHGVTILDLAEGALSHRHLSVPRPVPILRIPATGSSATAIGIEDLDDELDEVLEKNPFEADTPIGLRPLIYLEMKATDAASVIMTEATGLVKARGLRLAGIRVRRETDAANPTAGKAVAFTQSLRETTPEALFAPAFRKKHGIDPEDRHLAVFRESVVDQET